MFVDAQLDAFERFATVFNLDAEQRTRIAAIVQFPIDADRDEETRRRAARIVDAVERGSIGRVAG